MKKLLTFLFVTILFSFPALSSAEEPPASPSKVAEASDTVLVKVKGLVCDFCARAVEKVFGKRDEVKSIKVDLNEKLVTIVFHPGKSIADEEVRQMIIDSGYNVEDIAHGEVS